MVIRNFKETLLQSAEVCLLFFFQSWMAGLHKWWTYLKMFGPNTMPSAMGLILLLSSLVATTTRKRHRYLSRSWLVRGSLWTSVFRRRVHSCASLQNSTTKKDPDWLWTSVLRRPVHSCTSLQNSARNKHPDCLWTSVLRRHVHSYASLQNSETNTLIGSEQASFLKLFNEHP